MEAKTPSYEEFVNFRAYVNKLYNRGEWKNGITLVSNTFYILI